MPRRNRTRAVGVRWQIEVPGHVAHSFAVVPGASGLLVSDGGGVAYGSMTLRRHDLATGAVVASRRIRDHARCFAFAADGSQFIAAFDKRLRRVDAESLEVLEAWDRRVPRYADELAWADDAVLLKNAVGGTAFTVDLRTGRQLRHEIGPGAAFWPRDDGRLIALTVDGSVWIFPSVVERPARVLETMPCVGGAVDDDDAVWIAPGIASTESFEQVSQGIAIHRLRPGPPATLLRRYGLRDADVREHEPGFRFTGVAIGDGELWLTSHDSRRVERLGLPSLGHMGSLEAPPGHAIVGVFPKARIALAARPLWERRRAALACLAA